MFFSLRSIIALIRKFDVYGRVNMLGADLLKYIQPQLAIRLYLYGMEFLDGRLCVVSSRVEDRASVEEEFKMSRFELMSTDMARQGVFEDTQMKVDIPGPFDSSVWDRLRLR